MNNIFLNFRKKAVSSLLFGALTTNILKLYLRGNLKVNTVKLLAFTSKISAVIMVLLLSKQTSDPSPKLIIGTSDTHANNKGHTMTIIHLIANPETSNCPRDKDKAEGTSDPVNIAKIGPYSSCDNGAVDFQANLISLPKAHHCCPRYL